MLFFEYHFGEKKCTDSEQYNDEISKAGMDRLVLNSVETMTSSTTTEKRLALL